MVETVMYATVTGVTRWSGGKAVLKEGQRFDAADPLARERPDLFSAEDPTVRPRSSSPVRAHRQCWTCRGKFVPAQTGQRYCGGKCRRERERTLARAARRAVAGASADPRRPASDASPEQARAYRAEVQARLDELVALGNHLAGRADPGDPWGHAADEAKLPVRSDRGMFRALVTAEIRRLEQLRNDATDFEHDAIRRAGVESDVLLNSSTFGDRNVAMSAHGARREQWSRELGGGDG